MSTPMSPGPASGRRRQGARLIGRWAPAAVLLGLLVLAWQVVAVHNAYLIPRIGAILAQLADHPGEFVAAAAVTLSESGVGLGASFVIAFSLAVAMSYIPVVERAVMPLTYSRSTNRASGDSALARSKSWAEGARPKS